MNNAGTLQSSTCHLLACAPLRQAHEYEQEQGLGLQQFFDSTAGKFKTETGCVAGAGPGDEWEGGLIAA